MKIRTLVVAVIIAVPVTVSAQTQIRDYSTNRVIGEISTNSQGQTIVRDYRTNRVISVIERNSSGTTVVRDYYTGRTQQTLTPVPGRGYNK